MEQGGSVPGAPPAGSHGWCQNREGNRTGWGLQQFPGLGVGDQLGQHMVLVVVMMMRRTDDDGDDGVTRVVTDNKGKEEEEDSGR